MLLLYGAESNAGEHQPRLRRLMDRENVLTARPCTKNADAGDEAMQHCQLAQVVHGMHVVVESSKLCSCHVAMLRKRLAPFGRLKHLSRRERHSADAITTRSKLI